MTGSGDDPDPESGESRTDLDPPARHGWTTYLVAALGTAIAVGVLEWAGTFLIVDDDLGPGFLVGTVLPGALLLAGFAALWSRLPAGIRRALARSRAGRTGDRAPAPPRRGP